MSDQRGNTGPGRLPDFLGIGAAKSGTTALDRYLRQHPELYLSRRKEPNFFVVDQRPPRFGGPGDRSILNRDIVWRLGDYRRLFTGAGTNQLTGEVSPRYLDAPGAAERIHALLPDVRLIAILRQPADRAWSQYSMHRRDGFERCATLEDALDDEPRRAAASWGWGVYFARGLYSRHLARYFELFRRDRLRVYLYEDLDRDPASLFRDLFEFLGVDAAFVPDTSKRPNRSGDLRNPVLRWLWTRPGARSFVRPFLPKSLRQGVSSWVIRQPLVRRQMPAPTRSALTERYREDISALQELIGRDLSSWLRPPLDIASNETPANAPTKP